MAAELLDEHDALLFFILLCCGLHCSLHLKKLPTRPTLQVQALQIDTGDLAAGAILGAEKTLGGVVSGQNVAESLLNILIYIIIYIYTNIYCGSKCECVGSSRFMSNL